MKTDDLDAVIEKEFAMLKMRIPIMDVSDKLLFKVAFVAGAQWALEKTKEIA